MEQKPREIKCRYCHFIFLPEPVVYKQGKKLRTYIECPRCGNGIEREYNKHYDKPRKTAMGGA